MRQSDVQLPQRLPLYLGDVLWLWSEAIAHAPAIWQDWIHYMICCWNHLRHYFWSFFWTFFLGFACERTVAELSRLSLRS